MTPSRARLPTFAVLALASAGLLLAASGTAPAQKKELFEPADRYYRARGFNVSVRWEVPRTTAVEGTDLTATLIVSGLVPPAEVVRFRRASDIEVAAMTVAGGIHPAELVKPDLAQLPVFAEQFIVVERRDPRPRADAREVRFVYTLRPRNRSVRAVPRFEMYYFNYRAPPGQDPFRQTHAEPVPIRVIEAPPPPPVPVDAPERQFAVLTGPDVLGEGPFVPPAWAWAAVALTGPLVAFGWFLVWRRVYPDAARLAHLRRSRAARRALDAIHLSGRTPDPPAAVSAALLGYIRSQFPLPEGAVTPSEIGAAMTELGVPADAAEQCAEVFRTCDRARFAPPDDRGGALTADAEAAVHRLEALP